MSWDKSVENYIGQKPSGMTSYKDENDKWQYVFYYVEQYDFSGGIYYYYIVTFDENLQLKSNYRT